MKKIDKKKELSEKLKALAPNISQDERSEWGLANGMGISSINKYFAGKIGFIIIGQKLLDDMTKISKAKSKPVNA